MIETVAIGLLLLVWPLIAAFRGWFWPTSMMLWGVEEPQPCEPVLRLFVYISHKGYKYRCWRESGRAIRATMWRNMGRGYCPAAYPHLGRMPCLEGGRMCTWYHTGRRKCDRRAALDQRLFFMVWGKRIRRHTQERWRPPPDAHS